MAAAGDSGDADLLAEHCSELHVDGKEFTYRDFLASGGFSIVQSAYHTQTNRKVALKAAQKKKIQLANEFLRKEIMFLRDHTHPNIIRLLGWFCERGCITAVLELAKGALVPDWTDDEWNNGKPVIAHAVRVLYGIADGMKFLHGCMDSESRPWLHLDLKTANILVMDDHTAKLADFGSHERSKYSDGSTRRQSSNSKQDIYTTFEYVPPERHECKAQPSRRYDVYAYGIVMWEVLSYGREQPYGKADDAAIAEFVINGGRPDCEKLHSDTPQLLRDLMKQCWAQKFSDRPRFPEIVEKITPLLISMASSGNEGAATGESSMKAFESQPYDTVDSYGSTVQSAAAGARHDQAGHSQDVDVVDAVPFSGMDRLLVAASEPRVELPGSAVEQGIDDEAGSVSRTYAQEEGDVIVSQECSNSPVWQQLYGDCLCVVGEAGAGKTRMVRSLQPQREFSSDISHQNHGIIARLELQLDIYKIIVNDFCGSEFCRVLLPLFAPPDGLVALVYDMTKPWQTQAEEVKKWMSVVIAVSPGMRLLVVGTHADLLDSQAVTKNMEDMRNHVDNVLEEAKQQLWYHVRATGSRRDPESHMPSHGTEAELEGPCCLWKTGLFSKSIKDVLEHLESIEKPVVLSFSCDSQSDGSRNDALISHILEKVKLRRPCLIESKWLPFVDHWLENTPQDSSLVWTLEAANRKFQELCNQENREALETILCYLAKSSYVIWLRDHQRLKDCIFHSPDAFLGIVSKLLRGSPKGPAWKKKDFENFEKGILTDLVLEHLLGEYQKDSRAIKLVLQHCNLVCTHGQEPNSTTILPCRLRDLEDSPSETNLASPILLVCIRIIFETWIIPLEFFYRTMASLILKIPGGRQAVPYCWKNGISYGLDEVKLRYKKIHNVLEIEARTESDKDIKRLWKHLDSLLCHVCGHVLSDYPGAMPKVLFVCPNWAYDPKRVEEKCHGFETELEIIGNGQEQGASTYDCPECRVGIPRAFVYDCKPESLSDDNVNDVALFMEKLRNKGRPKNPEKVENEGAPPTSESGTQGLPDAKPGKPQKKTEATQRSDLAMKFHGARTKLIQNLDINAAFHILDCLYSAFLVSEYDKEEVEAESLRADMIRRLVDITERRGDVAMEAFLVALESDQVLRSDLASDIRNMRLH